MLTILTSTQLSSYPGLDDFTAADEALRQGLQLRAEQEDAAHVSMEININIPEVALDLTYDVALARHLVLAVRTLEMQVRTSQPIACFYLPIYRLFLHNPYRICTPLMSVCIPPLPHI